MGSPKGTLEKKRVPKTPKGAYILTKAVTELP
jgi:hypothetical protein